MGMPQKKFAAAALVSIAFGISAWGYVAIKTLTQLKPLLVCSQGRDELVPKTLCQFYMSNYWSSPQDIAELNQNTGVVWALNAKSESDRKKILAVMLRKGVNINAIDSPSGITALHAAVLENNLEAVKLLIENGANTNATDEKHQKTPLDFALDLKGKPNQPERQKIIEILQAQP